MRKVTLVVVIVALICGIGVAVVIMGPVFGINGTASIPVKEAGTEAGAPLALKKDDADNPLVKEARPATEAALTDLLAGKYDNDANLYPVARKVKGFTSWSIETQEVDPDLPRAVRPGGTLRGPRGEAAFSVLMVRQHNGQWMIGTLEGPSRK